MPASLLFCLTAYGNNKNWAEKSNDALEVEHIRKKDNKKLGEHINHTESHHLLTPYIYISHPTSPYVTGR